MRIGQIKHISPTKGFGFIASADLQEDVFFHFSVWQSQEMRADRLRVGDEVEYDLDDLAKINYEELRATKVIRSRRPQTVVLDHRSDDRLRAQHHPKARRRKPLWRPETQDKQASTETTEGENYDKFETIE